MEEWTEILDNGGTLDSIYIDFMKVLDKVPHKRMLRKLRSYGLSEQIIKCVEDFLRDRSQKVSVKRPTGNKWHTTRECTRSYIVCYIHK
jgi:hypothetical protein